MNNHILFVNHIVIPHCFPQLGGPDFFSEVGEITHHDFLFIRSLLEISPSKQNSLVLHRTICVHEDWGRGNLSLFSQAGCNVHVLQGMSFFLDHQEFPNQFIGNNVN